MLALMMMTIGRSAEFQLVGVDRHDIRRRRRDAVFHVDDRRRALLVVVVEFAGVSEVVDGDAEVVVRFEVVDDRTVGRRRVVAGLGCRLTAAAAVLPAGNAHADTLITHTHTHTRHHPVGHFGGRTTGAGRSPRPCQPQI